jgi:hypothetical protein
VVLFVMLPTLGLTIAASPFVGRLWIGHHEPAFVLSAVVLTLGTVPALLSTPAYYAFLGLGYLRSNLVGLASMLAITTAVGLGFGPWFGGEAVILGYSASYLIGCAIIFTSFHRRYDVPWQKAVPVHDLPLLLAALSSGAAGLLSWFTLYHRIGFAGALLVAATACTLLLGPAIWRHPMRGQATALARRLAGRARGT